MITNVYLEKFKSFEKPIKIDLSDITVIAGSNSCGKSSIIQMLLLLAQTLEHPRTDLALGLGGRYVQFAEFREIVYGRPKNTEAEFTIGFELNSIEINPFDIKSILLNRTQLSQASDLSISNIYSIRISFKVNQSGIPIIKKCTYEKTAHGYGHHYCFLEKGKSGYRIEYKYTPKTSIRNIDSKHIKIYQLLDNLASSEPKVNTRNLDRIISKVLGEDFAKPLTDSDKYDLRRFWSFLPKQQKPLFEEILKEYQSLISQSKVHLSGKIVPRFEHFLFASRVPSFLEDDGILSKVHENFRNANNEIAKFLRSIQYIGPLRAKPERAYLATGTPIEIGNSGENAIPLLWLNQKELIRNKTKINGPLEKVTLEEAVRAWMAEFGIANSFHITKPKRVIYQAEMESNPGSKINVTIADVGFGVSQLLPVIIAGLLPKQGSILILEQPEIHLHPRLQGKLADFLVCMSQLGKKIIVESHSEHLVNMLRLRIVQDVGSDLQNRVNILFVRPPHGKRSTRGSSVENLRVDKYGSIVNWPSDFFPETGDLTESILKARFERVSKGE